MQKQVVKQVTFYSKKGTKLAGDLYSPNHIAPKEKLPAILLCQGLSGVKDLVLPTIAQAFTQKRFIVLAFDYSGFGDSEGEKGYIDPLGRCEDALYALAFLKDQPNVDPRRIGVYGLSLGGGVAAYLATQDHTLQAAVIVSGFGSGEKLLRSLRTAEEWVHFKEVLEEDRLERALTGKGKTVFLDEIFPFPKSFQKKYTALKEGEQSSDVPNSQTKKEFLFALESVDFIREFDLTKSMSKGAPCPILFIHGGKDNIIPVEDIFEIYQRVGDHRELIILDEYDHLGLDHGSGLATQINLSLEWFCQYI